MRKIFLTFLTMAAACKEPPPPPPPYLAVPVERRDIVVSARANGAIQPDTTVEVKSKASGEILEMMVETGGQVKRGQLMVTIDPRQPRNTVAQAEANLDVAKAKLANATAQKHRADELFGSQALTETEHDQAMLDFANAKAEVVSAQVDVENAKIQLEDTDVRAPISGTIIEKDVERGQVISSPTKDVGGGTVLLKMADLNLVQVKTLVDETDIGKIQPGLRATITVDAYPNRPFDGSVLKIEPQATVVQNVTMFPVLVRIENREGLLQARDEHRSRNPRRPPRQRARDSERRAANPARCRLRGPGAWALDGRRSSAACQSSPDRRRTTSDYRQPGRRRPARRRATR